MTSTLKAVCLIAALLAALGASAAAASPLLSADDMSTLRGGWLGGPTLRCEGKWCGPGSGVPESCKDGPEHFCNPEIPAIACDNQLRTGRSVNACGSYPTGDLCKQGSQTNCGSYGHCFCNEFDVCDVDVTLIYWYRPCLNP
jgi:hypothetical protein